MKQIVECVPNFSEGRDMAVIEQITAEIKKIAGVELLDVDPGRDTNRTVVTFAGSPAGVEEAAFQAIKQGRRADRHVEAQGAPTRAWGPPTSAPSSPSPG